MGFFVVIGYFFERFIYEFLVYWEWEYWGMLRRVNEESVFLVDKWVYFFSYDNVDFYKCVVLIIFYGKDFVFVGICGIDKGKVF